MAGGADDVSAARGGLAEVKEATRETLTIRGFTRCAEMNVAGECRKSTN